MIGNRAGKQARAAALLAATLSSACVLGAQSAGAGSNAPGAGCVCGAHPPGPQANRTVEPYAGTPEDLKPFGKFAKPYDTNYTQPNIYSGAARDTPDPTGIKEVRIGFLGPVEKQADQVFGLRMLHGAQLAVERANARGGYGGAPFRLMIHDDYNNWQRGAEYGAERPTASSIWGSTSDEAVKMIYDEQDWAIFGSISSESTHIILRVALRGEIPIINSASTDPTIPETYIPWYFTDLQDDRVQSYTLARRIFTELGLKRVALLRINNRYGRFGVIKFRDAARRLGHPVVIEQKFMPGDTDFRRQLRVIRDSRADGIVLWADEEPAAQILLQMQELGMKQRVFGSHRTLGYQLLQLAGPAAEGFEAVFPYDPTRNDVKWIEFSHTYQARFQEEPEQFAALAYDGMNILLESICRAGLNRARIQDALDQVYRYDGVTGAMVFDPLNKNVSPMYLGTVLDGRITYRIAPMVRRQIADASSSTRELSSTTPVRPYARVGEDGITYSGPHEGDPRSDQVRIVLFGQNAESVVHSGTLHAPASWTLLSVESDQNWGAATTQLVHAVEEEHPLVIIALDRNAAHLAEQLSLKAFIPVLALSNDRALTSTNISWIFRLPANTGPSEALHVLEEAVRTSGNHPERLREVMASGANLGGVHFSQSGEPAE